tara:strand:- start:951 stop:1199 length:249 start_codon:yes stop_codon:yes gene_type:complete
MRLPRKLFQRTPLGRWGLHGEAKALARAGRAIDDHSFKAKGGRDAQDGFISREEMEWCLLFPSSAVPAASPELAGQPTLKNR